MKTLESIKTVCEIIGGSREPGPEARARRYAPVWRGLWWGLLAGAIILFCGQTSKFIYIDF
jgi:hypothetical protein